MTATAPPRPRQSILDVVRSEWTKLMSVRSIRWTAIGMIVLTVGLGVLITSITAARWDQHPQLDFDSTNTTLFGIALGQILMGAIGALVITGEYSSGAIRSTLTAVPNRSLLLGGKALMLAISAVVAGLVLSVLSFLIGEAILGTSSAPTASFGDPGVARAVLLTGVGLALIALIGMGLGTILRNSAGSIVGVAIVALVLPAVLVAVPGHVSKFAPTAILDNSFASVHPPSDALSPGLGLLMMVVYAAVLLVAGGALLHRRDA